MPGNSSQQQKLLQLPPLGGLNLKDSPLMMDPKFAVQFDNFMPPTDTVTVRPGADARLEINGIVKGMYSYLSGVTKNYGKSVFDSTIELGARNSLLIKVLINKGVSEIYSYDPQTMLLTGPIATPSNTNYSNDFAMYKHALFICYGGMQGRMSIWSVKYGWRDLLWRAPNTTVFNESYMGDLENMTMWSGYLWANSSGTVDIFYTSGAGCDPDNYSLWDDGFSLFLIGGATGYGITPGQLSLDGLIHKGGSILRILGLSRPGSDSVNDYLCVITNRGEVVIYGGIISEEEGKSTFGKQAQFEIPTPINKYAICKMEGDVVVVTKNGLVSIMKLMFGTYAQPTDALEMRLKTLFSNYMFTEGVFAPFVRLVYNVKNRLLIMSVPTQMPMGLCDIRPGFTINSSMYFVYPIMSAEGTEIYENMISRLMAFIKQYVVLNKTDYYVDLIFNAEKESPTSDEWTGFHFSATSTRTTPGDRYDRSGTTILKYWFSYKGSEENPDELQKLHIFGEDGLSFGWDDYQKPVLWKNFWEFPYNVDLMREDTNVPEPYPYYFSVTFPRQKDSKGDWVEREWLVTGISPYTKDHTDWVTYDYTLDTFYDKYTLKHEAKAISWYGHSTSVLTFYSDLLTDDVPTPNVYYGSILPTDMASTLTDINNTKLCVCEGLMNYRTDVVNDPHDYKWPARQYTKADYLNQQDLPFDLLHMGVKMLSLWEWFVEWDEAWGWIMAVIVDAGTDNIHHEWDAHTKEYTYSVEEIIGVFNDANQRIKTLTIQWNIKWTINWTDDGTTDANTGQLMLYVKNISANIQLVGRVSFDNGGTWAGIFSCGETICSVSLQCDWQSGWSDDPYSMTWHPGNGYPTMQWDAVHDKPDNNQRREFWRVGGVSGAQTLTLNPALPDNWLEWDSSIGEYMEVVSRTMGFDATSKPTAFAGFCNKNWTGKYSNYFAGRYHQTAMPDLDFDTNLKPPGWNEKYGQAFLWSFLATVIGDSAALNKGAKDSPVDRNPNKANDNLSFIPFVDCIELIAGYRSEQYVFDSQYGTWSRWTDLNMLDVLEHVDEIYFTVPQDINMEAAAKGDFVYNTCKVAKLNPNVFGDNWQVNENPPLKNKSIHVAYETAPSTLNQSQLKQFHRIKIFGSASSFWGDNANSLKLTLSCDFNRENPLSYQHVTNSGIQMALEKIGHKNVLRGDVHQHLKTLSPIEYKSFLREYEAAADLTKFIDMGIKGKVCTRMSLLVEMDILEKDVVIYGYEIYYKLLNKL
jgi:hypothetical protein